MEKRVGFISISDRRTMTYPKTDIRPPTPALLVLPKDFPDHHDAELVLRLYELRREPVLRESRSTILRTFWPTSLDDVLAVAKSDHPLNAAFRQVSTYWEMAYGMVRQGVLHADFMLDSNSEGLVLYARVAPYLADYRKTSSRAFRNAEWIATQTEMGRDLAAHYSARVKQTLASRK